jgi:hypothetical protein
MGPALPALAQATPSPTSPPSASPGPAQAKAGGPDADKPGPFDFEGRIRRAISEWFADLVASALEPVFKLLGRTVLSTPRMDANDRISDLWKFSLALADAGLVVFVLAGAGMVIFDGGSGAHLTAKEALPRLLAAAAVANLSLVLLKEMTELSNALSRGVMGSLTSETIAAGMADKIFNGAFANPFLSLLALFVIVLAILVAVAYIMRIAILVVLTAAAPLLLVTHALPHSENWARLWWRGTLALLSVPVAQSFLVVAGFQVFLSGDGLLGFSSGGLVDLLVIGSILYLLFKIPFWGLDVALSGAGSATWRKTKQYAALAARAATSA